MYRSTTWAVAPCCLSEVGNVAQTGYQGMSSAYSIQNGKIVTWLQQTPFEATVYKVGDKYFGAQQ